MVNENIKLITENKKLFETVCELKDEYKVPSYEEFMKTYKSDGNLNYANLSGSDIGEVRGYGPCIGSVSCSNFSLRIECHNWNGLGGIETANSTSEALNYAHMLEDNNWPDSYCISDEVLRKCATLIREAVRYHDQGNKVDGYVKAKGKFWGSYDWKYSY